MRGIKTGFVPGCVVLCAVILAGCGTSRLNLRSFPTDAHVTLLRSGIEARTDSIIGLPEAVFESDSTVEECLLFEKSGYRPQKVLIDLREKRLNKTDPGVVPLDPLDTKLVITSEPPGAYVTVDIMLSRDEFDRDPCEDLINLGSRKFKPTPEIKVEGSVQLSEDDVVAVAERTGDSLTSTLPSWLESYPVDKLLPKIKASYVADMYKSASKWARIGFVTPAEFVLTAREARMYSRKMRISSEDLVGHFPEDLDNYGLLTIEPGETNIHTIRFKPIVTTLKVMTDPEGAFVEEESFGYLGQTPLIRNFTWDDIVYWNSQRAEQRPSYIEKSGLGEPRQAVHIDDKLYWVKLTPATKRPGEFEPHIDLKLKIEKPGFSEAYIDKIVVPLGEERSFFRQLKEVPKQIYFSSDPAGVHVYVVNEDVVPTMVYDDESKTLKKILKVVEYKKHLGTTPFTLNMDQSEPIEHGARLIFEKSDYAPAEAKFSLKRQYYHEVMQRGSR